MSIDLKLLNGDIAIGSDDDFGIVTDSAKLIQDVIKAIVTPQGSNKYQPQLGSLVNERLIGKILSQQNTTTVLQGSVQEALVILQKLQKQQAQLQALTPAETLVAINSITVARDSVEPRQLNLTLKIIAADGNLLTDTLTIMVI